MRWCGVVHAFTALALSLDLRAIRVVGVDCPETVRHWPSEIDGDQNPNTVLYIKPPPTAELMFSSMIMQAVRPDVLYHLSN